MSNMESNSSPRRINVLTLDGGGIRGLSSLLILQDLMGYVNESAKSLKPTETAHEDIQPHHIFNLVAGTSTGGLIAIMLGKLGMTVDECIFAYEQLASDIFGKKHFRARFTGGLTPTKYSGSRMKQLVRALLSDRYFDEDLKMHSPNHNDRIACTLVCREHEIASQYSEFLPDASFICSLGCPKSIDCLVCEAARATSSAPTFFPVQAIGERYFADGGMEFNNPSHEIWRHYSQATSIAETKRRSAATDVGDVPSHPGGLDFSEVRFVNLGTGDQPIVSNFPSKSSNFAWLIPAPIRMGLSLKKKLIKMAVSSERTADVMRGLARVAGGRFSIEYERFSADNGVCFIKMDKYRHVSEIYRLTREYLAATKTKRKLKRLGSDIAKDYLAKQNARIAQGANNHLPVPQNIQGSPQTPEPQIIDRSPPSVDTQPYVGLSMNPESSIGNTPSRGSSGDPESIFDDITPKDSSWDPDSSVDNTPTKKSSATTTGPSTAYSAGRHLSNAADANRERGEEGDAPDPIPVRLIWPLGGTRIMCSRAVSLVHEQS